MKIFQISTLWSVHVGEELGVEDGVLLFVGVHVEHSLQGEEKNDGEANSDPYCALEGHDPCDDWAFGVGGIGVDGEAKHSSLEGDWLVFGLGSDGADHDGENEQSCECFIHFLKNIIK
jgi:hypothetical protein